MNLPHGQMKVSTPSGTKQEAGTANHEGMAGLQQPLVHAVTEILSLLHTTKNNILSPLLHIKKSTTCYLEVTLKKSGCFITLPTGLPFWSFTYHALWETCTWTDKHMQCRNFLKNLRTACLLSAAVSLRNFNWTSSKQWIAQHDQHFNRETRRQHYILTCECENVKPARHAAMN